MHLARKPIWEDRLSRKVLIGIKKTVNRCDSKKSDFLWRSSFDDCYAVFMRLRC